MIPSALKLLASRLLVVAALAGIASAQSTYFQYFSQPGDFVGGGQSGLLTQPLWDFDISYLPTTGVHITIQQAGGGSLGASPSFPSESERMMRSGFEPDAL